MPHRYTDIPIRPGDRRNVRRGYIAANGFEAMLAVAAIVAGASSFLHPRTAEQSALGDIFGWFALAWSMAYLVSGVAIIYGLLKPSIRVEVVGLCVLAGGIAGNAFVVVSERGWVGAATAAFYIGWSAASIIRARLVVRLSRIVELDKR